MWTMVCALGLWIVGLGLAFVLGYLAAERFRAEKPARKPAHRKPAADPLAAEKLRQLQREIDNFMHYDGMPQEKEL